MNELEILKYNILSQIEKEELDAKCGERTGDALAVWEVQNAIRQIKDIIKLT